MHFFRFSEIRFASLLKKIAIFRFLSRYAIFWKIFVRFASLSLFDFGQILPVKVGK